MLPYQTLEISSDRIHLILKAAAFIRRNYSRWKEYLAYLSQPPPKPKPDWRNMKLKFSYSEPLDPELEEALAIEHDKPDIEEFSEFKFHDVLYALNLLDSLNLVHLDPKLPFVPGQRLAGIIKITDEFPADGISSESEVKELWNKRFRGTLAMFQRPEYAGKTLYERVMFVAKFSRIPLIPIEDDDGGAKGCAFDLGALVETAVHALAFETPEEDILEIIAELFPQCTNLIPEIIKKYYFAVLDDDAKCCEELRETVYEEADCNTEGKYESTLRHAGALAQMRKRPSLFTSWALNPTMRPVYNAGIE